MGKQDMSSWCEWLKTLHESRSVCMCFSVCESVIVLSCIAGLSQQCLCCMFISLLRALGSGIMKVGCSSPRVRVLYSRLRPTPRPHSPPRTLKRSDWEPVRRALKVVLEKQKQPTSPNSSPLRSSFKARPSLPSSPPALHAFVVIQFP